MRPLNIVEAEVVVQPTVKSEPVGVVHQIDVLILDAAPQTLNKDVVQRTASAVHADLNTSCQHGVSEGVGCELSALIGVEDVRCALLEGLAQSHQTELTIQGVGKLPGQHVTTVPVDDSYQVHEATSHRNVGDIGAPDLVRTGDLQSAQEIRVYSVPWSRFARVALGIERLQAHHLHQALDPFVIDQIPLAAQVSRHSWPAVERCPGVLLIDQAHEQQVMLGLASWLVIGG